MSEQPVMVVGARALEGLPRREERLVACRMREDSGGSRNCRACTLEAC